MGPVAIFDKSFLQGLSPDESLWFDMYFESVITPIFFVETLADLSKALKEGRTSENEVGGIANKTPEQNGYPTMHHATVCRCELAGREVVVNFKPLVPGGQLTQFGDKSGLSFGLSPEAAALQRWRERDFLTVERDFAQKWREGLAQPFDPLDADFLRWRRDDIMACRSECDAKALAQDIVNNRSLPYERMRFAFDAHGLPPAERDAVYAAYRRQRFPRLSTFAPYTAHVMEVDVFFRVATARGEIFSRRVTSNRCDIAYLFYLPFGEIFVSSDDLHRRCAPLFLKPHQRFIWGHDLKEDLKRINAHYAALPEEIRRRPVFEFGSRPPSDRTFLTTQLWDHYRPNWRDLPKLDLADPEIRARIQNIVNRDFVARKPIAIPSAISKDIEALSQQRIVRKRKGNWNQLPPDPAGL